MEESLNINKSAPTAKPEDIGGQNPKPDYYNSLSVNKEALGLIRTELENPVQSLNIPVITSPATPSEVSKIQVDETPGGIKIIKDDTHGNVRILIKHPDGGGIEFGPNGSVKLVSIKGKVEIVGSDTTLIVGGDALLEYQGNLNMKVTGEFNIDCLDFNLTTKGNKVEKIYGSEDTTIGRGSTTQVVGSKTTYVTESVIDTYLGGHEHNVKGNLNHNVNGEIGIFASGDVDITSETDLNIASPNVTASADNMTVQGSTGVIGSDGISLKGETVVADTFYGDLSGKAEFAALADKATGATTAGQIGSAGTAGSITETPIAHPMPTASLVSAYNESEFGIKEVTIDEGDDLKNFIDQSKNYLGIHHVKPSIAMARSALRDPANKNNIQLTKTYLKNGIIDSSYTNPTPPGIGRIVTQESVPIVSRQSYDVFRNDVYATYVPKAKFANITPEKQYDPFLQPEISAKTKLNDNVSLAKFLGTEDPTNLAFLRNLEAKQQLAKYLYVHGTILQKIQDDADQFKGISLIVSEGVYRPGPSEVITPNSTNDLKLKGKAIVYSAVGVTGTPNNQKLFDIAAYIKDNAYFKKMILSYDTLEGYNKVAARLIVILPDIDDNWDAVFDREVDTEFNGSKLSQGELVEVLPYKTTYLAEGSTGADRGDSYPHHGLDQTINPESIGYDNISNGKLDPKKLVQIAAASPRAYGVGPMLLEKTTATGWSTMVAAAAYDGINLVPTSAYRSYYYQQRARIEHRLKDPNYTIAAEGTSNHGLGLAIDISIPGWSRGVDPSNLPVWKWLNENARRYGFKQKESLKYKDAVHWSRTTTGG
jgi:hypothetical protein